MIGALTGFLIIAVVIAAGYVVGRTGLAGPGAQYTLNRLAYFVANPALLFTVIAKADLHTVLSTFVLIAAISAAGAALIYAVVSAIAFKRPIPETVIGILASSYTNANNIGLPVAVYVLGDASFVAPVLILQILLLAPIALTVLDVSSHGSASIGRIISQPVRNPMIIASVLGIIVAATGFTLPDAVLAPFTLVGGAAVPLVLMAFGMSLHGAKPLASGGERGPILLASLLKVAAMPTIAFLVAHLALGLTGRALFAAVVLAALPTAQNIFNFASRYERGVTMARDTVLVTTVASVPAIVLIAALLA